MLEVPLGGRLSVAKQLALAIPQPWTSKLAADEWEGAVAKADKGRQGWQQGPTPSGNRHPHLPFQSSGSRRRRKAGFSLCVSSTPFPFSLLALPGPAPSRGVPKPSAAHCALGQPCSASFSAAGLSGQRRASAAAPLSSARSGGESTSGRFRD